MRTKVEEKRENFSQILREKRGEKRRETDGLKREEKREKEKTGENQRNGFSPRRKLRPTLPLYPSGSNYRAVNRSNRER